MNRLVTGLERLAAPWTVGLALGLAMLVGWLDYYTGFDLQVTAFYLIPICWVSWAVGRRSGLFLAAACTVIFAVTGVLSRHGEIPLIVPLWNSLMLLLLFVGAVYPIAAATSAFKKLNETREILKETNEHLEETVQRRTAALRSEIAERQRLEQDKRHTERLLERQEKLATLGTLTAGIAHEIRNPLTSLKARLYKLDKHSQPSPAAKQDIEIISAEILRLERILQEALSFARPTEPKLEPLSIDDLLREVQGLMSSDLEGRSVQLIAELNSGLSVAADSGNLKQVLINLVRNAADSIVGAGTVTLRAHAARTSLRGRETDAVVIEVHDTGSGIPPEVERRLFDPFFSTKETGTGLGLPIAARIIEKHGGVIQYDTRPGKGTTFEVVLPRESGFLAATTHPVGG